ncbi:MAG: DUF3696 domain-containing protein [Nannocystaceae bacterium]
MLESIRFKNFKAWADTGTVRLAPLTVVFGGNSAGKTSFAQLLLLLKQTAASPDRQRVLHLGDSHALVDLGTFEDVIHRHEVDRSLEIELAWTLPKWLRWEDPYHRENHEADALQLTAVVQQIDQRPTVARLSYQIGLGSSGPRIGMERQPSRGDYKLTSRRFKAVRQVGRKWPLPPPVRFYGFPEQTVAYYQNTAFVADLNLETEKLFQRIHYVGPLREPPQRVYVWSGERPEHVGQRGERAIEALLAASGRSLNFKSRQRVTPFQEVVAERLQRMGLVSEFKTVPIAEGRKEHEVLVRTHPSGPMVRITDVGFGVSQILPVVTECFYVPHSSTVIFEQPEIHLHPRVQADLADLFIDALRARESGSERKIQLLVESHSEHFLRRLQRRIAEQQLRADDVAAYFVEMTPDGAQLRDLEIDDYGNVTNWPPDFFGDEMADLMAMTEAARRRRAESHE